MKLLPTVAQQKLHHPQANLGSHWQGSSTSIGGLQKVIVVILSCHNICYMFALDDFFPSSVCAQPCMRMIIRITNNLHSGLPQIRTWMASKFGILLLDYRENLTRNLKISTPSKAVNPFPTFHVSEHTGFFALSKCLRTNAAWGTAQNGNCRPKTPPQKKNENQQPRRMQWCQPYNCIHPIPSHPTNEELFATRRPSWVTSHSDQEGDVSGGQVLYKFGPFFFHDSGHPTSTFCGANRWKTESFKRPLASIKRVGASNMLICAWLSLRIKSPK